MFADFTNLCCLFRSLHASRRLHRRLPSSSIHFRETRHSLTIPPSAEMESSGILINRTVSLGGSIRRRGRLQIIRRRHRSRHRTELLWRPMAECGTRRNAREKSDDLIRQEGLPEIGHVGPERQQLARSVRLVPDAPPGVTSQKPIPPDAAL